MSLGEVCHEQLQLAFCTFVSENRNKHLPIFISCIIYILVR